MLVAKSRGGDNTINEMVGLFEAYLGASLPQGPNERRYCQHIKRKFGDRTLDLVKFALAIQTRPYAPSISTPKELFYKYPQVIAYSKRNNAVQNKPTVLNLD